MIRSSGQSVLFVLANVYHKVVIEMPGEDRRGPLSAASIAQGSHTDVTAEVEGEGTLVIKTELQRKVANRGVAVPEPFAGGLDSGLDEEGLRRCVKRAVLRCSDKFGPSTGTLFWLSSVKRW